MPMPTVSNSSLVRVSIPELSMGVESHSEDHLVDLDFLLEVFASEERKTQRQRHRAASTCTFSQAEAHRTADVTREGAVFLSRRA